MRLAVRIGRAGALSAFVAALLSSGPSTASTGGVRRIAPAEVRPADAPRVSVLSSSQDGLTLRLEVSALAVEQFALPEGTFQSISLPGGGLEGAEGEPGIPVFSRLVAIPKGASVEISAQAEDEEELPGYTLMPVQGSGEIPGVAAGTSGTAPETGSMPPEKADGTGAALAYDPAAYARDGLGSTPAASAGRPAFFRDLRVVPLTFRPVRYNPARRTLEVARSLRVQIRFAGTDLASAASGKGPAGARPIPPSFDRLYRALVANYAGPAEGERIEPGTWLLICPDDLAVISRLQPLLDWRRREGIPVRLATTTETGSTKEQIKDYIQNAYDNWPVPPEFVVLAGDATPPYSIPTWNETLSGMNGEGDHPYTKLAGDDILSDVHIGRLSFSTLAELETIVAKTVGYESTPYLDDPSWFTRACLVGDPTASGISCVQVQQWIKTRLLQLGYTQVDTVFAAPFVSQMTTDLNRGDTIFCYRGSMGFSGWSNSNIYAMTNGWKMPFGVMCTCGTGSFAGGTANSEAFLRAGSATQPKGAIGAIATATTGTHTRYNNCYTYGVFQGLLYEGDSQLGAAHTRGKLELYLNYGQSPQPQYAEIFAHWNNLMGDPAVECWTGLPQPLAVEAPSILPVGANMATVSVREGGIPCAGARVCLWKESETYATGRTDSTGGCTLPIDAGTAGEMLLTVTGHDLRPFLSSIPVSPQPVYVGFESSVVDDDEAGASHGNADGQVNPGESIELAVGLHNFGSDGAAGVTALLTSLDPYASVTAAQVSFGDLPAGSTGWGAGSFVFNCAPGCPDGRDLRFDLLVSSGSSQWHSLITLPAISYRLETAATTVYDFVDGILDPGETVDLSVLLRNAGDAPGEAITGTLRSLSPWVTVTDSTGSFGTILPGGQAENTADRFTVSAAPYCFEGYLAVFSLLARSGSGAFDTSTVTVTVGQRSGNDPVGPDHYGYYAFDNTDMSYPDVPIYDWVECDPAQGGTGTEILLGDFGDGQDKSRTIDLPFPFRFYGRSYSTATACSNGWLAMGATWLTDYRNWTIPGAGAPNNLLAVFWDELVQGPDSRLYQRYDEAGHRWILEWSRFRNLAGMVLETFEVILYDPAFYSTATGDGQIDFQYLAVNNVDGTDGYATVGIQNFDHTDGLLYTYFNQYPAGAAPLVTGRAIRFVPVAEAAEGTLEGMVGNASHDGSPVAGAEVKLLDNGRFFLTGADGRYSASLRAGTYTVVASHPSFVPDTVRAVVVAQSEATTVDFSLVDIGGPDIASVEFPHMVDSEDSMRVQATIGDQTGVSAVEVVWRIAGGAWGSEPMAAGGDSLYEAVLPPQPVGTMVEFYIRAVDVLENESISPPDAPSTLYRMYAVQALFADDFETDQGWSPSQPGDTQYGRWLRWDPVGTWYGGIQIEPSDDHTPAPGTMCFETGGGNVGGAPGESDVDGGCVTLTSPLIDLSGAQQAFVSYWRWFALEGAPGGLYSATVSNDGGGNWHPLETLLATQNAWTYASFDLNGILPLTAHMRFRFVVCDLGSESLVEGAVDDFLVNGTALTAVEPLGPGGIPARTSLLANRPNPFTGATTLRFALAHPGPVRLRIYDAGGRCVRLLSPGALPEGEHALIWDGRGEAGETLGAGVYFYELQAGGFRGHRKMVRIK